MTTTTRNRIIAAAAFAVVVLIIIVFSVGGDNPAETVEPQEETPSASAPLGATGEIPSTNLDAIITTQPAEEDDGRTAAEQVAELFSERYGSYSNQGNYQNLRDLLLVMSPSYRSETETFLRSVERQPPAEIYEGTTSTKVSTQEVLYDSEAGTAVYDVTLQQIKVVGTQAPETDYRILRLSLARIGDVWKVSSAEWQD